MVLISYIHVAFILIFFLLPQGILMCLVKFVSQTKKNVRETLVEEWMQKVTKLQGIWC